MQINTTIKITETFKQDNEVLKLSIELGKVIENEQPVIRLTIDSTTKIKEFSLTIPFYKSYFLTSPLYPTSTPHAGQVPQTYKSMEEDINSLTNTHMSLNKRLNELGVKENEDEWIYKYVHIFINKYLYNNYNIISQCYRTIDSDFVKQSLSVKNNYTERNYDEDTDE